MSSTAISNAVGKLERELAVRLFNRTTRSVSLTHAGRIFVAQRTIDGSIQVAWQVEPNDAFDEWVDLGGTTIGAPALVADADGFPVLLMHAANGSLHVAELTGTSPIAWGDWSPAGG